jgi:hypothetical protein
MTNDDWILTANFMEQKANEELKKGLGHFMSNYWEAIRHIAKAYYHADGSNQKGMRVEFKPTFTHFNNQRQGITVNV